MADTNLFEKYGIKEVADVTFYRIEKTEETYESQREFNVASILKGAIEVQTVYEIPDGAEVSGDEAKEAYVFKDAEILSGMDFQCDDDIILDTEAQNVKVTYTYKSEKDYEKYSTVKNTPTSTNVEWVNPDSEETTPTIDAIKSGYVLVKRGIVDTKKEVSETPVTPPTPSGEGGEPTGLADGEVTTNYIHTLVEEYEIKPATETTEGETVVYGVGSNTHEYSYAEQLFMLFAKNQNLVTKAGVRYSFDNVEDLLGAFEFVDNYATAPSSSEKVVVLKYNDSLEIEEINEALKTLTESFKAKAYDVAYKDYAELSVDDEMGYFDPSFLGKYEKKAFENFKDLSVVTTVDDVVKDAKMWGDDVHFSINDAIMALREQLKAIDMGSIIENNNITAISGGYKVNAALTKGIADNGEDADHAGIYTYNDGPTSGYALTEVLKALSKLSNEVEVATNSVDSNRAIYVDTSDSVLAPSAYIYILENVNSKTLKTEKEGIFKFANKFVGGNGYYQDKIFAGTKTLALVIIGGLGMIFKVNRYGTRNIEKIAWVMNENGYPTATQCEKVVNNGVIHTVDVTVNDETFDATCTLNKFSVRKTNKKVNRYVPVLFLDTLKVSTLEQTAEQTAATGGKGNAQLIIWDYGKEITLTLEDALYTPASMSAMLGAYEGNDFTKGVKETKRIDRTEKCIAKRSFIVPAGNSKGVPSEGDITAQAVYIDLNTMQPYQDGAPIAEGEVYLKWTRSVAYGDNSLGNTIEISAEKFPGTYKIVGDTFARNKTTGEDQRFQFVIPQAKMSSEQTITLEAEGDPTVFNMTLNVLRPDDGVMVKLIQYDVVENEEENDGSTMVKGTENLNLLDDAEMFKVSGDMGDETTFIGATEY